MYDNPRKGERELRLALPSKGRMEEEAMLFLLQAGLPVRKPNPRQYIGSMAGFPELVIWFQRSADIVRRVAYGDVDLGITGLDSVAEYGKGSEAIVVLHDALDFGHCRLSIAIPETWDEVTDIRSLCFKYEQSLAKGRPLRFATKFPNMTKEFFQAHGIEGPLLIPAEGALEAAPQMAFADAIIDLVSSGTTLRENHLKEIEGGCLMQSQAALIGHRQALLSNPQLMGVAHRLVELIEAHLRAQQHHLLIANIRGASAEDIARKVFTQSELGGLQGPTISPVFLRKADGDNWFAINLVVRKDRLDEVIRQVRYIGGSGVVVIPATYIFEEEPPRWNRLLNALGLQSTNQPA